MCSKRAASKCRDVKQQEMMPNQSVHYGVPSHVTPSTTMQERLTLTVTNGNKMCQVGPSSLLLPKAIYWTRTSIHTVHRHDGESRYSKSTQQPQVVSRRAPVGVIVLASDILLLKLRVVLLDVSSPGSWFAHQGTPLLNAILTFLGQLCVHLTHCLL